VRVALLGGTGSFGQALARRLVEAGVEVVIGSRDAERARETAAALGADGSANEDAVAGVDLVVLAVKSDAALDTARELRAAIGATPLLSPCAELEFGPGGVRPTPEAT
jgi:8-hydroxy-5-deazaflavin:NADPH oxidoreductase